MLACGVALVPCGFALGSIDLVRIGTLLGGVVLVAAAFAARRTLDLTVERVVRPARVQVDEPTTVTLVVAAPRGGASPAVRAEETLGYALGDRPRFVVPGLRGDASCRLTYGVRPTARGRHRLGPLAVAQADPLGLTQRRALVGGEAELVALPRLGRLDGLPSAGAMAVSEGAARHRSAAHGHDDVTVREYREGDELRRVHWPATARTGEVMVRQEDLPSRRSATVVLDPRPDRHLGSGAVGTFEWAVSAAASVATPRTAPTTGYGARRSACRPRKRGDSGVFSSGNWMVILRWKKWRPVSFMPLSNSSSRKVEKKSLIDETADMATSAYFQMFQGDWIHRPTNTSQTSVTGMKIFQPRRMIWS